MATRNGESGRAWFRTDRFVHTTAPNCAWYVTLREGGMIGPFDTRRDAEIELFMLLRNQGVKLPPLEGESVDVDWFSPPGRY